MMRAGDLVGRFGGEEFVLLLLDAGTDVAYRIAERLRLSIANSAISVDAPGVVDAINVTVSIGVATLNHANCRTLTDMIAAADLALYQAKRDGRNRTFAVTDTTPPAPLAGSQPDAGASGEIGADPPPVGGTGSAPGNIRALCPRSPLDRAPVLTSD
jgi:hypothetical protein